MRIEKLVASLVKPKAQKLQMFLGSLAALLILIPLSLQLTTESARTEVIQLDARSVTYCELQTCRIAELGGLEVVAVQILEQKWATFVEVRFVNFGRLSGERELWLELVNPSGQIAEAAKSRLVLSHKGPIVTIFSFQRTPEALINGQLRLGH